MILTPTANRIKAIVSTSSQSAYQAYCYSPLVIDETCFQRAKDIIFHFEGLVLENLNVEVIVSYLMTSLSDHLNTGYILRIAIYAHMSLHHMLGNSTHGVHVHRASVTTTEWPGEFIELHLPEDTIFQYPTPAVKPHIGS